MVQRLNRVLAEVTGDDGSDKLVFDGKTLVICWSGTGFRGGTAHGPWRWPTDPVSSRI